MTKHILLVDDDVLMRRSLALNLEEAGYRASTAATAEAALDVLPTFEPSLVITDVRMPGMNGLECIEMLLRQGCGGYASHILLISGNTGAIDMTRAREYGCTVMQKPVSLHELERWLEDVEKNLQGSLASSK